MDEEHANLHSIFVLPRWMSAQAIINHNYFTSAHVYLSDERKTVRNRCEIYGRICTYYFALCIKVLFCFLSLLFCKLSGVQTSILPLGRMQSILPKCKVHMQTRVANECGRPHGSDMPALEKKVPFQRSLRSIEYLDFHESNDLVQRGSRVFSGHTRLES